MNASMRLVAVVAGLVLMLYIAPSWGQPPDPTDSDANFNTAGGTGALFKVVVSGNPQGFNNTAFGFDALLNATTGQQNTAIGSSALKDGTIGSANTAIGAHALQHNTGFDNTALGANALATNTSGILNTASGLEAMLFNTTGNSNTANGAGALRSNTSGLQNVAIGQAALHDNTTGGTNTASGFAALTSNTIGNLNTAAGFQALNDNTAGLKNTSVGAKALKKSTGTKNIGIGYQAGVTLTTGNNNIYIGNQGAGDESQTIRVGTAQTSTFIAGIAATSVNGAPVEIDTATGQLGIPTISSARYKRDIAPMGARSQKVLDLHPVTFAYKNDAQDVTRYGLIAEEVAALYPQLVTYTPTGEIQTVRYQEMIPLLLNELRRQRQDFQHALQSQQQALQTQAQALQRHQQELAGVATLRKELAELRALLESLPGQPAGSRAESR